MVDMSETRRSVGRPSKYQPEFAEQGLKLCLLGATDKQLADFFGVAESTLNLWKQEYPEFSESLREGKQAADSAVANSLYRRALGYSHKAVKILAYEGSSFEHEYTEHYPPDTTACIFWLKNRQPAVWRDRMEVDHRAPDGPLAQIYLPDNGRQRGTDEP